MKKIVAPFLLLILLSVTGCQKTVIDDAKPGEQTTLQAVNASRKMAVMGFLPVYIYYSQSSGSLSVEWESATGPFEVTIQYGSTTLHYINYQRTSFFISGVYLSAGATISASVSNPIGDSGSATYTVGGSSGGQVEGPVNQVTANVFYQHANKLSVSFTWSTSGVDNNTRYYFFLRLRSADGYFVYRRFTDVAATSGAASLEILGPYLQPDDNEVRFVVSTLPMNQSSDPSLYTTPIDVNFYLQDASLFTTTYYCSPPFFTYL